MHNADSLPLATTTGKSGGACKSWCAVQPQKWMAKCSWEKMCDACPECGGFFICAREGIMHIHKTIVELSLTVPKVNGYVSSEFVT